MPVIQKSPNIAAGATVNLLTGSTFEFARTRQVVSIGITQAATGMFATINSGTDVVAEEFEPVIATRFPVIPDEMYYNDVMESGDRLVVQLRNPTAGAIIGRCIVQISQV